MCSFLHDKFREELNILFSSFFLFHSYHEISTWIIIMWLEEFQHSLQTWQTWRLCKYLLSFTWPCWWKSYFVNWYQYDDVTIIYCCFHFRYLSHNKMSEVIPSALAHLPKLTRLWVQNIKVYNSWNFLLFYCTILLNLFSGDTSSFAIGALFMLFLITSRYLFCLTWASLYSITMSKHQLQCLCWLLINFDDIQVLGS